jgi:hypothetical protein
MIYEPALVVGAVTFVCVFGGALVGMLGRERLPEHHLTKETEDVVKLGMSVIATLSALVIGLLLASAKASFETKDSELKHLAADLILLDRDLAHYGPETTEARDLLRRFAVHTRDSIWPQEAAHPQAREGGWKLLEDVQERVRALMPGNEVQGWLRTRALQVSGEIAEARWLIDVQKGAVIPRPFLAILVFWLTLIFASFGLFAPRNAVTLTAFFLCSAALAGSMILIVSMAHPVSGLIPISSAPMREALDFLGR